MMDFSHRFEGYNDTPFTTLSLTDSISSSSRRAEAIINMLQSDVVEGRNELTNETVFEAMEAVRLECIDIKKTVEYFNQAQKSPTK